MKIVISCDCPVFLVLVLSFTLVNWHIWHFYKKHYQVLANTFWPSSGILTYISCFAPWSLTMKKKPKLWLVITPVSLQPHQYMLFDGGMRHSVNSYSSLFNQGPNSPKFHGNPPHFVFTLHPSVFLHSYYHVTAQRLHQSYWHGSCKFNPSLHYNLIFLMFFFMEQ